MVGSSVRLVTYNKFHWRHILILRAIVWENVAREKKEEKVDTSHDIAKSGSHPSSPQMDFNIEKTLIKTSSSLNLEFI